jgi:hypothetical protein
MTPVSWPDTACGRRDGSCAEEAPFFVKTPHARSGPVLCRPSRAQGAPLHHRRKCHHGQPRRPWGAAGSRRRRQGQRVGYALSPGRPAQGTTATGVRCLQQERRLFHEGRRAYSPEGARTAATDSPARVAPLWAVSHLRHPSPPWDIDRRITCLDQAPATTVAAAHPSPLLRSTSLRDARACRACSRPPRRPLR